MASLVEREIGHNNALALNVGASNAIAPIWLVRWTHQHPSRRALLCLISLSISDMHLKT